MKKVYLLPNLFTTGNLFCGVNSVLFAVKGNFEYAAWMILIAMFFDFLDGMVARLTHSTSFFGVQYDSLCDLISFGMAPSLLIYFLSLSEMGRMGIAVVFVYVACCALRLARFNSQFSKEEKKSFSGLPSPAAAGILATFVLLLKEFDLVPLMHFIPVLVLLVSYLMVSHIRYPAFKVNNLKVRRPFFYLVGVILALCMAAFHTELFLFCGFSGYLIIGILGHFSFLWHRRAEQVPKPSH